MWNTHFTHKKGIFFTCFFGQTSQMKNHPTNQPGFFLKPTELQMPALALVFHLGGWWFSPKQPAGRCFTQ